MANVYKFKDPCGETVNVYWVSSKKECKLSLAGLQFCIKKRIIARSIQEYGPC